MTHLLASYLSCILLIVGVPGVSSVPPVVSDTIITVLTELIYVDLQSFLVAELLECRGVGRSYCNGDAYDSWFTAFTPMLPVVSLCRRLKNRLLAHFMSWVGSFSVSDVDRSVYGRALSAEERQRSPFTNLDLPNYIAYIKRTAPHELGRVVATTDVSATVVNIRGAKIGQKVVFLGGQTASVTAVLADDLFCAEFIAPPSQKFAYRPIDFMPEVGSVCVIMDPHAFRNYYKPLP